MKTPSLQELLEAGVHFGHQVNRWHPHMEPYIFTSRENIHIIDLLKTRELLETAANYLKDQAKEGKVIMFVGTKHQAQDIIKEEAVRVGAAYVSKRWIGGLITNWEQIKRNIDKLNTYEREKDTNKLDKYTKKERLLMDRKMAKLNSELSGIKHLSGIPDVLFLIDPKREMNAVLEAKRKDITVVALCDTNTNPQLVDYVIPGNDDSIKSLRLIIKTVADAIEQGREAAEKSGKAEAATKEAAVKTDEIVVANVEEVVKEVVEEVEGVIDEEVVAEAPKAVVAPEKVKAKPTAKKPAVKKVAKKTEKVKEEKTKAKPKKATAKVKK